MITEHSMVVLNEDRIADGLSEGDVGAVVHIHGGGQAYEVEFVDGDGSTIALLTLEASEVRSIEAGELLHARRRV
jgi:ATP-dependent exoDNAse (exonuclease V) alpha subunit